MYFICACTHVRMYVATEQTHTVYNAAWDVNDNYIC